MPLSIPTTRTFYRRSIGLMPHTLERHTEPIPFPLPVTSILIRVHAVSLNFRDPNILNGTNPWPVLSGGVPCSDAAGEIISIGSQVQTFKVGDSVCPILDQKSITGEEQQRQWLGGDVDGVLASHIVMDEQLCVRMPDHLSWAEAACLPNAGVTAWSSLVTEGRKLVTGQAVLLQGTGGVSMMALKLALAGGCKVFVTSSSDEKLDRIRQMTREKPVHCINYKSTPNWDEKVLHMSGTSGIDIVIENGGTPTTLQSLRAVKKGGIVSQVGYLGKQDPQDLDGLIPLLIDKSVNFRGINVGSRLDFEQMNKVISATKLQFEDVIDRRFTSEEAADAFRYLWEGRHVGKVVIEMPEE